MKAPDLAIVDDAGVHPWTGATDPLKAAAAHAHLKFAVANLAHAKDRATLFAELDRALKLPEHFGNNWDALADCLEDSDWLGAHGIAIVLRHAAAYRKAHAADWETLSDILSEAAEYWQERHKPFWVFVS